MHKTNKPRKYKTPKNHQNTIKRKREKATPKPSPAGPNHISPHNAKKIQIQTALHEMQKTAHFPT
ncbi:hypothetical protein [Paraburkholderia sediminicola]|uniref:hypothetical protein n=1 Tax=Paraburkholderia sediminicola TaxID=458836 RepID=UPI0038BCA520